MRGPVRTSPGGPVRVLAAVVAAVLLAGCAALPQSGPVVHEPIGDGDVPLGAPYFDPPAPVPGASPTAVVSGFLTAMQANPISTQVARTYLSDRSRATWQPNRRTVVYGAVTVTPAAGGGTVRVGLTDVRRLDGRGGWVGPGPGASQGVNQGGSESLQFDLVREDGEWRIDDPVDALVVPTSFFNQSFERLDLFFFDQTDRVLLPDPVFVPRGEQSATNLTRSLLEGPGPALAAVTRTAFPRGTALELSVTVTESGVAEVPLTGELLRATPAAIERAYQQLRRTLGQVPGVERVRVSVDGTPVGLPSGAVEVAVDRAPDLDAAGASDPTLVVLQDQRLRVEETPETGATGEAVEGPGTVGELDLAARSLGISGSPRRVALVSPDGTTLSVADLQATEPDEAEPRPIYEGTDLGRASFDMFGTMWVLDRAPGGARVLVQAGGDPVRQLEVPEVSGEEVTALSVAFDGSRLAVVYGDAPTPRARVVDVLRGDDGVVSGAGGSRLLEIGRDVAETVDIGWRDPATLAVLTRPSDQTSRVDFVSADGAPVIGPAFEPGVFRGVAQALLVSPRIDAPLRLVADDQTVHTLGPDGTWPRTRSRVEAADYTR